MRGGSALHHLLKIRTIIKVRVLVIASDCQRRKCAVWMKKCFILICNLATVTSFSKTGRSLNKKIKKELQ